MITDPSSRPLKLSGPSTESISKKNEKFKWIVKRYDRQVSYKFFFMKLKERPSERACWFFVSTKCESYRGSLGLIWGSNGEIVVLNEKKINFQNFSLLVEAASRFWNNFDVAYTFNKFLENVSKKIQDLQNDCRIQVFRKFLEAFCKKSMPFLENIHSFLQDEVISFSKQFFSKSGDLLVVFKNCFMKHKADIVHMYITHQVFPT